MTARRSYHIIKAPPGWRVDYYKGEDLFASPYGSQFFLNEERARLSGRLWIKRGCNLPSLERNIHVQT